MDTLMLYPKNSEILGVFKLVKICDKMCKNATGGNMRIETTNPSLYSKPVRVENKIVRSLSDFTAAIQNRNKRIYQEVVEHPLSDKQDPTFTPKLVKGNHIDTYA